MSATQLHRPTLSIDTPLHMATWRLHAYWAIGLGVLGFALSAVLSGALELQRTWFVAIYLVVLTPVIVAYLRTTGIDVGRLFTQRWVWGLAGATVMAIVMSFTIQRMDASARDSGATFVWEIVWFGVVYGVLDALLLNVLPVLAVWRASLALGHTAAWRGKLLTGAVAYLASLYVTVAYHLGFAEFRGGDIAPPMIGNSLMTLAYIVTANPLTALVAHVALHVASVIHGIDSTVTLPPHY